MEIEVQNPETGAWSTMIRHHEGSYYRGTYTWVGSLGPRHDDSISLTVADEAIAGHLSLSLSDWQISGTAERLIFTKVIPEKDECTDQPDEDPRGPRDDFGDDTGSADTASPRSLAPLRLSGLEALGPYASVGLPVVDLLVVYPQSAIDIAGSESAMRASVVNAVVTLNTGLIDSEIDGRVRLIGIEQIAWTPEQYSDDAPTLLDITKTTAELGDGTHGADEAHWLRDHLGADLVLGVTPPFFGATGGAWRPKTQPGPSTDSRAFSVVNDASLGRSLRHEIGHNVDLRHYRDGVDCADGDGLHQARRSRLL